MKILSVRLPILWTICLLGWTSLHGQGGITTPRGPSPGATVSQTIGISTVTVTYSRPSVKGRTIWGDLVPYGWNIQNPTLPDPAPWRAGANENTTITFSHAAQVEGHDVPAGTYGLFFTIEADGSGEVILSKDYRSWGAFHYDPARDQVRAGIKTREHEMTELLTYDFINLDKNGGELVLNWEKKQFPVRITFQTDQIVLDNAAEELKGPVGFTWQGYASAANYALQNNIALEEGLAWADRAATMNRNFTSLMAKSGILSKLGKKEEAAIAEKEAVDAGTENEINTYGYQLLNQGDMEGAIRFFKMNTERFPKSANTWDSLGEGYFIKGDKENAIANFKKSLSLDPPAATRDNSMKYLKKLGALSD